MREAQVEGRIVMMLPICRNCPDDMIMNEVDSEFVPTDGGGDMVYTYVCPRCGFTEESINLKYPYQKFIPTGQ